MIILYGKEESMSEFFYELKHDIGADYFTVEHGRDLSFPLHMHRCFEIILVTAGSMKCGSSRMFTRWTRGI